jgi:hypothetical protein
MPLPESTPVPHAEYRNEASEGGTAAAPPS